MNRPTLRQLEYAIAVADHGHFGRAAEAAMVSQPGLSAQIRELEQRLGIQLFERTTRQVRLSAAGRDLIERAREILLSIDDLIATADTYQSEMSGTIRFAAIPTLAAYVIPTTVKLLRTSWPNVSFELHEMRSGAMIAALETGDVDLGILALPYDTGRLHVESLGFEPFLLAVPPGHEYENHARVPLEVLADLEMLLLSEGHCLREHARSACEIAGSDRQREVHDASLSTLMQMVALDSGVTLLPSSAVVVEARADLGIRTVPFDEPAPGRDIAIAWRTTDPRTNWYQATVEPLRATVGEVIAAGADSSPD